MTNGFGMIIWVLYIRMDCLDGLFHCLDGFIWMDYFIVWMDLFDGLFHCLDGFIWMDCLDALFGWIVWMDCFIVWMH